MGQMQFSLRMLFAAVAFVGIGAALWVAEPSWQVGAAEFLLITWLLTSAAIKCANSTGREKAFWTGAAANCMLATFFYFVFVYGRMFHYPPTTNEPHALLLWSCDRLAESFRPVLVVWAFAPVVGLLCVLTHWLLVRPKD